MQPSRLTLSLASALSVAGCDRTEDPDPLAERIDALEQTIRDLEKTASAERAALAGDVKVRCQTIEVPVVPGSPPTLPKRREMDPELQRRMDEVGVKMLEDLSGNEEMQEVMKNAGKFTAKALEEMTKELSED